MAQRAKRSDSVMERVNGNSARGPLLAEPEIVQVKRGVYVRIEPVFATTVLRVQSDANDGEPPPAPPTYTAAAFGRPEEVPFYDLETIEGFKDDEEEYERLVAALREYNVAITQYNARAQTAVIDLMKVQSLWPCDEAGEDLDVDTMRARLEASGLRNLPGDYLLLKAEYVEHWVMSCPAAAEDLISRVALASVPQEEEVQAHLKSFLLDAERDAAGDNTADGAEVGVERGVPGDGGGG